MHANLIGGAWVDGADVARNVNPSNTADVVGEYARADARAGRAGDRAPPRRRSPAWSRTTIAQRADVLDRVGAEILARAEELGDAALARGGQDAAGGHRRGDARRRRSSASSPARRCGIARRAARLAAARRPGRGHARADRRRRAHHALELPHRDPGLEDRAGARLRQHASSSSPPTSCPGSRAGRWPTSSAAPALPAGVFNLVMGRGSVVGEALTSIAAASPASRSPARSPTGRAVAQACVGARRQGAARDGRQEPARRARRRRPRRRGRAARCRARTSRPASAARPPAA